MDLFEKQVKHYTDKYNDTKKIFDERDYSVYQNMLNVKDIKKELIENLGPNFTMCFLDG